MLIFLFFCSYLVGSVSFAYFFGRLKGVDLRQCGSGNLGATNTFRVLGKKLGILVFICDALKGVGIVWGADLLSAPEVYPVLVAAACGVVGHVFPFYLRFQGGKGVAILGGAFLYLCPLEFLLILAVFALLVWRFKYVSLASVIGASVFPVFVWMNLSGMSDAYVWWILRASVCVALIVVVTHRKNIRRLLQGKELKIF